MQHSHLGPTGLCLLALLVGGCSGADDAAPLATSEVKSELTSDGSVPAGDAAVPSERAGRGRADADRPGRRGNGQGPAGARPGSGPDCDDGDGGVVCAQFIEEADGECSRTPDDACRFQDPDCTAEGQACEAAGQVFPDGSAVPSGDSCNTCGCNDGSVICTLALCEEVACLAIVEEPDGVCSRFPLDPCISQDPDCAASGQACEVAGQTFPDGSAVPSGDSCNSCACNDGGVSCTLALCEQVFCAAFIENPDGVCSRFPLDPCISQDPDCAASGQACEVAGQVFPDGSSVPSGDTCNSCACGDGSVNCTRIGCEEVACALFIEESDGVCSRFPLDPCISQDPDCVTPDAP